MIIFSNSSQLWGAFKAPVPFLWVRRAEPGPQQSGALSERLRSWLLAGMQRPRASDLCALLREISRAVLSCSFNWLIHLQSK